MQPDKYDLSEMSIDNTPYSGALLTRAGSKYDDLFSKLQQGQRIKCPPEAASALGTRLRKWLKREGYPNARVATRKLCEDGAGGVWWLGEREAKPERPSNVFDQLVKRRRA